MKKTFWILALVIILRLYLVVLPSFKIDMNDWQAWSERLTETTPLHFYSPTYFSDYFPGYLYMLWFLSMSFKFLFPHLSTFSLSFEIYLKSFTNLFDVATAYFIYKIISRYKSHLSLIAPLLYLANPALIFNSSIWGQVDGILAFFLVYSTYCLLELKNIYKFSFFSALSIIVKPQGLAIFPITIVHLLTNFKHSKYISILIIPPLLFILALPFFLNDPLLGLFHLFQKSTNTYPFTSMFSYNFWSFAGWWIPDATKFLGISYRSWGIAIYLISLILILIPLIFKKGNKNNFLVYYALSLASFAFFLFLTRIHQRYLFPFFAFLLIVVLIKKNLIFKIIYLILSLIHLTNLWYVYYYYNYVYQNPKFSSFVFYKFLSENYNWFSIINLLSFGLLIFIYYRSAYIKENHA